MKTEKETRDMLAKCKRASRKFMSQDIDKICPTGHGCCPECSTMGTLEWVLHRTKKERIDMKTEQAVNAQIQQVVQKRAVAADNSRLRNQMRILQEDALRIVEQIEDYQKQTQTGFYILLTLDDKGKWSCVDIIDPDDEKWETEEIPAFALIMPIPEPETMPEFDGF